MSHMSHMSRATGATKRGNATKWLGLPAAPFTTLNRLCRALNHSKLKLDKMQAQATTNTTIKKHLPYTHIHICSMRVYCVLLSWPVSSGRGGSLFQLTLFLAFAASIRRTAIDFLLLLCQRMHVCVFELRCSVVWHAALLLWWLVGGNVAWPGVPCYCFIFVFFFLLFYVVAVIVVIAAAAKKSKPVASSYAQVSAHKQAN